MNIQSTNRYPVEKIALAAIFAISLLAAWLVMTLRSVIRMSLPVELSRSGLSVSMPSGGGWRCDSEWAFDNDGYALRSVFAVAGGTSPSTISGIGMSLARCRYLLAGQTDDGRKLLTPEERFAREASAVGGELLESGQMEIITGGINGQETTENLIINWARIKTTSKGVGPFDITIGICELPAGRQLEIEVLQSADEQRRGQSIFERIAKAVQFSDNGLLQEGRQMVNELKTAGPNDFRNNGKPSLFILKDNHEKAIGFTMDAMEVRADEEPAIKAANYYYLRRPAYSEDVGVFQGDIAFGKFIWRVEMTARTGKKGIEMSGDSGVLTIMPSGRDEEKSEYNLGMAAVPDIIIDLVTKKMLEDAGRQRVIIDVIRSQGSVVPVYVEKINPSKEQQDVNYALRIELLDGQGNWQQVYYNSLKEPVNIIMGRGNNSTHTLTRSDAEEIAGNFPERADFVRDRGGFLEKEEL